MEKLVDNRTPWNYFLIQKYLKVVKKILIIRWNLKITKKIFESIKILVTNRNTKPCECHYFRVLRGYILNEKILKDFVLLKNKENNEWE